MRDLERLKNPAETEWERKHREAVRKAAPEGMVLLENDGSLPLPETTKKIALFGAGARNTVKGGVGSGDVNTRYVINIEEGLKRAGLEITTDKWLDRYQAKYDKSQNEYAEKLLELRRTGDNMLFAVLPETPDPEPVTEEDIAGSDTDTAIYVISRNSGEGKDRRNEPGDYQLTEDEKDTVRLLAGKYEHFIVLLNTGSVIDTEILRNTPGVSALLLIGQAGDVTGDAAADVLTGKAYPSGKLTDTWAMRYEDYPGSLHFGANDGDLDDSFYNEGIYVGYRYFDTFGVKPAYHFGYGLSYTRFETEIPDAQWSGSHASLCVSVKNAGENKGKEIVQVYCSKPAGELEKPYQELVGFAKTKELCPGETARLRVNIPVSRLASYSEEKAAWILEAGNYILRVGTSSEETIAAMRLTLDETVILEQLSNQIRTDGEWEELCQDCPAREEQEQTSGDVPVFLIDPEAIRTYETAKREKDKETEEEAGQREEAERIAETLSVKEQALLCVGCGYERDAEGGIIGNSADSVPGAAGETTMRLRESCGIPAVILADGPAGLRLDPVYGEDGDGNQMQFFTLYSAMTGREDPETEKDKSKAKQLYYQYCTALPIATMLAQSWNMELISELGNIVGQEMEEFGIDLWLAPGMNIHRNPLCGRNFEYYSEDPLLSGCCAAADTKGVQSCQGKGTTIKHFAGNNQEDNRFFTNSYISERALREIYLKGFEICVKEAQPAAVMTSYNLLNGIHSANRRDMLTDVLRQEWGFRGLVMTDWSTTLKAEPAMLNGHVPVYPESDPALCIHAGNDLIMPGTKKDVDRIVEAAGSEESPMTAEDLRICASRVILEIMKARGIENR